MANDDPNAATEVLQALVALVQQGESLDARALENALHEMTGLQPWQCKLLAKTGLKLGQWALKAGGDVALSRAEELLRCIPIVRTLLDGLAELHVQAGASVALENRLRKQLEEPELLPLTAGQELLVAQFLLEQLPDLRSELREELGELREKQNDIQQLLHRELEGKKLLRSDLLRLPEVRGDHTLDRLKYASGAYPFLGRDAEMEELERFLGQPDMPKAGGNFRWTLWVGAGGMGKSRLAFELCLAIREKMGPQWHGGFLRREDMERFLEPLREHREHAQPPQPMLIVVDYPAQQAGEVGALLSRLAARADKFRYPVRVLLLERENMGDWVDRLLSARLATSDPDPRLFYWPEVVGGKPRPRELKPLPDDVLVQLMRGVLDDVPQAEEVSDEELLAFAQRLSGGNPLDKIAPELSRGGESTRTLLALAAAEYLRAAWQEAPEAPPGKALAQQREEVFEALIERERKSRWQPVADKAGVDLELFENVLALATAAGDVQANDLNKLPASADDLFPTSKEFKAKKARDLLLVMGGGPKTLSPLQPDILGEWFFLHRLREEEANGFRQPFIDAAWTQGAHNDAMAIFLLRLLLDYPGETTEEFAFLAPSREAGAKAALSFAKASVDAVNFLGELGRAGAEVKKLFDSIVVASDEIPEELRKALERPWRNIDTLMHAVASLRDAFPNDAAIALEEAKAAVNVTSDAGEVEDWERVDAMLARLGALREAFPDDAAIALHEAKAAVNVTNHAGAVEDWERVDAMLARLDALREAFPDDAAIALHEAMAAFNVTSHAGKAGEWERVDAMLARLDALREAFPDDAAIALAEAKAAVNVTSDAGKAGERERVDAMLVRLDALREAFPDDAALALHEAMVAVSVTILAGEAGDWGRVDAMLARFTVLRKAFPGNAAIALAEAQAAVNVTAYAGAAGEWERMEAMLARLDALREAFPDDAAIALKEAMAAFNTTNHAGAAGDWDRVDAMLARLDALREAFPGDAAIALHDAKATVNVTALTGEAGDWERVDAMLARLDALRGAFPNNAAIAEAEARAAFNVANDAGKVGDWERVDAMLARLDALREAFPDDAAIALAEAKTAVNVTILAGEAGDWERVDAMLARLEALRRAFPDDNAIALQQGLAFIAVGPRHGIH